MKFVLILAFFLINLSIAGFFIKINFYDVPIESSSMSAILGGAYFMLAFKFAGFTVYELKELFKKKETI